MDIYENEILCLLGHNGAGKTTLINLLNGNMDNFKGHINILGHDIRSLNI